MLVMIICYWECVGFKSSYDNIWDLPVVVIIIYGIGIEKEQCSFDEEVSKIQNNVALLPII